VTNQNKKSRIRLDWSRLLGFDQVADAQPSAKAGGIKDPRLVKLGSKIGGKIGGKQAVRGS
jgi:hypothetical protein